MARGRRARLRAFDIPQQYRRAWPGVSGLSSFPTTKKSGSDLNGSKSYKMSERPIKAAPAHLHPPKVIVGHPAVRLLGCAGHTGRALIPGTYFLNVTYRF
jgi:hypothetical protein